MVPALFALSASPSYGVPPLCVNSIEQEPFDLVCGIQRQAFLLMKFIRVGLENTTNVGAIRSAILVDDLAEHHDLTGAEIVGRSPVEGRPIETKPQVAFPLRGETSNVRPVERQG